MLEHFWSLGVNKVKFSSCPVAFGEVSIKTRIKSIVNYKKANKYIVLASLCLCVAVSVCFMTEPEAEAKKSKAEQEEVVVKVTTEKVTEPSTEPTTEPSVENATEAPEEAVITQQPVVEYEDTVEETTELIIAYAPTAFYESPYNNYKYDSGLIADKPNNRVTYPTVTLFPDVTPNVNYRHTNPYNPNNPNTQFNMW